MGAELNVIQSFASEEESPPLFLRSKHGNDLAQKKHQIVGHGHQAVCKSEVAVERNMEKH